MKDHFISESVYICFEFFPAYQNFSFEKRPIWNSSESETKTQSRSSNKITKINFSKKTISILSNYCKEFFQDIFADFLTVKQFQLRLNKFLLRYLWRLLSFFFHSHCSSLLAWWKYLVFVKPINEEVLHSIKQCALHTIISFLMTKILFFGFYPGTDWLKNKYSLDWEKKRPLPLDNAWWKQTYSSYQL